MWLTDPSHEEIERLLEMLATRGRRPLLLARRAHLYPSQADAIARVVNRFPDALVVSLREPFDIPLFGAARHVVAAYGDDEASIGGLADVIFGSSMPTGHSPRHGVTLSLSKGDNVTSTIDALLENASGREFTAAVARIEHRGRSLFERAYGVTRTDELARPVYADTLFDIASLTKLFVATLALRLVAQEKLDLDEPLCGIISEWRRDPHAKITARMLLAHTSGMNSGADYREILGENVEAFALRSELVANPGERVIYSDLGFIALGVALRRVSGFSLGTLVARTYLVFAALSPLARTARRNSGNGRRWLAGTRARFRAR